MLNCHTSSSPFCSGGHSDNFPFFPLVTTVSKVCVCLCCPPGELLLGCRDAGFHCRHSPTTPPKPLQWLVTHLVSLAIHHVPTSAPYRTWSVSVIFTQRGETQEPSIFCCIPLGRLEDEHLVIRALAICIALPVNWLFTFFVSWFPLLKIWFFKKAPYMFCLLMFWLLML